MSALENTPAPNDEDQEDWFLQALVVNANKYGLGFSITLQACGIIVSGTTISGKKYFDETSRQLSKVVQNGELADHISGLLAECAGVYEAKDDEPQSDVNPSYIHLQNARFFDARGNAIPSGEGVLWRGRISRITGFNMGQLGTDS